MIKEKGKKSNSIIQNLLLWVLSKDFHQPRKTRAKQISKLCREKHANVNKRT
jgi:hypothetical protein